MSFPWAGIDPLATITVTCPSEVMNEVVSEPCGVRGTDPTRLLGGLFAAVSAGGGFTHR
jgi:hypothetical protein